MGNCGRRRGNRNLKKFRGRFDALIFDIMCNKLYIIHVHEYNPPEIQHPGSKKQSQPINSPKPINSPIPVSHLRIGIFPR